MSLLSFEVSFLCNRIPASSNPRDYHFQQSPVTRRVRKAKVSTPNSPPSADDSFALLQVFPHRARAEVQPMRCFAQREQAISNRRGVTLPLVWCFHFVVSSRSPVAFIHGLAAQDASPLVNRNPKGLQDFWNRVWCSFFRVERAPVAQRCLAPNACNNSCTEPCCLPFSAACTLKNRITPGAISGRNS